MKEPYQILPKGTDTYTIFPNVIDCNNYYHILIGYQPIYQTYSFRRNWDQKPS